MTPVFLVGLLGLVLSVLPVSADQIDALFQNDVSAFTTMDTMSLNGPFLSTVARQTANFAVQYPSKRQLVVTGGAGNAGPQEVNVGGLVVQPGARLPLSLREIIIMGQPTERITVVNKRKRK